MSGWIEGKTKRTKEYYTKDDLDWIILVAKPVDQDEFIILRTPPKEESYDE